jgi:hypothetical protein
VDEGPVLEGVGVGDGVVVVGVGDGVVGVGDGVVGVGDGLVGVGDGLSHGSIQNTFVLAGARRGVGFDRELDVVALLRMGRVRVESEVRGASTKDSPWATSRRSRCRPDAVAALDRPDPLRAVVGGRAHPPEAVADSAEPAAAEL